MEKTGPNKLSNDINIKKQYRHQFVLHVSWMADCLAKLQGVTIPDTKIYKIIVRTEVFNY